MRKRLNFSQSFPREGVAGGDLGGFTDWRAGLAGWCERRSADAGLSKETSEVLVFDRGQRELGRESYALTTSNPNTMTARSKPPTRRAACHWRGDRPNGARRARGAGGD